jgi:UPF0716 protein FxsA
MNVLLRTLLLLPLLEIIGFFVAVAHIGFLLSFLWLCGSTMLGFYLLRTGTSAWQRNRDKGDGIFQLEDAFDSLCVAIAALLLIFPGFVSDFIAVPFLLAPFRHWLFGRLKDNPNNMFREGYRSWSDTHGKTTQTVIDGEFRRLDDTAQLPEK